MTHISELAELFSISDSVAHCFCSRPMTITESAVEFANGWALTTCIANFLYRGKKVSGHLRDGGCLPGTLWYCINFN